MSSKIVNVIMILFLTCSLSSATKISKPREEIFFGNQLYDRQYVDGWKNFYMADTNTKLPNAEITEWNIIANRPGPVQFLIYRRQGNSFRVIGKSKIEFAKYQGLNSFNLKPHLHCKKGDLIGWYVPKRGVIGYNRRGSPKYNNLKHSTVFTNQNAGATDFKMSSDRDYSIAGFGYKVAGPKRLGGAAIKKRPYVDTYHNFFMVDDARPVKCNALLTGWRIYSKKNGRRVQLIMYRRRGRGWQVIGKSKLQTAHVGVNKWKLTRSLQVRKGDRVGWYVQGQGVIGFSGSKKRVYYTKSNRGITALNSPTGRTYSIAVDGDCR
jgi:hypothetical protein